MIMGTWVLGQSRGWGWGWVFAQASEIFIANLRESVTVWLGVGFSARRYFSDKRQDTKILLAIYKSLSHPQKWWRLSVFASGGWVHQAWPRISVLPSPFPVLWVWGCSENHQSDHEQILTKKRLYSDIGARTMPEIRDSHDVTPSHISQKFINAKTTRYILVTCQHIPCLCASILCM